MKYCGCREMTSDAGEGKVNVQPIVDLHMGVGRHNCEYVKQRTALIPDAVGIANRKVPEARRRWEDKMEQHRWGNLWTKAFAQAMERLAAPLLAAGMVL